MVSPGREGWYFVVISAFRQGFTLELK